MNRREFIQAGSGLLVPIGLVAPSIAQAMGLDATSQREADAIFWSQPRTLRLKRVQTGEYVEATYFQNGKLNAEGYIRICKLLRDVKASLTVQMDFRLMDLLRAIQGYVEFYGYKDPIHINSGYRSPKTNASIEGAARNSQHMKGKAVDFSMPGLPSTYMGLLASHYKAGGVGFYPDRGFVHLDTANVRYWGKIKNAPQKK